MPAQESAFLERLQRRTRRSAVVGVVLGVGGGALLGSGLARPAHLLGAVALLCGVCSIWGAVAWSRLLRGARTALSTPPLQLTLDRWCTANRYSAWKARLQAVDGSDGEVAWFGAWQLGSRRYIKADKLPVHVYGWPARGAVVLVSSPSGMLVGPIAQSSFARTPAA
jgi:hypothetical protein